jgi:ADP-ribosylglycohydrolase
MKDPPDEARKLFNFEAEKPTTPASHALYIRRRLPSVSGKLRLLNKQNHKPSAQTNMENTRVNPEYYRGCMLGAAVADNTDGLMQLALFTAEGLLRATHRAKMHGSNGTIVEILHESYRRWLGTRSSAPHMPESLPANDGWLICREEMYAAQREAAVTAEALRADRPGDIGNPVNAAADYEGVLRIFPVGLMFPGHPDLAFRIGMEATALTHGAREAFLTGGFLAAFVSALAGGMAIAQAVEAGLRELAVYRGSQGVQAAVEAGLYLVDELAAVAPEQVDDTLARYFACMGEASAAARVVAYGLASVLTHPFDYVSAVNLARRYPAAVPPTAPAASQSGNASDAAAMTAGLVCGLKLGVTALPHDALDLLYNGELVAQVADDLLTGIRGGIYIVDREWLKKYPGW